MKGIIAFFRSSPFINHCVFRGPKKKKAEKIAEVLSQDIVNIWKERKD